jgi:hypothetical protein
MPRDSGGAYTLPSGNPVVDGTVIESVWANDLTTDLAVQLNNVFTRDGLLGPIAPVLFVNGTLALPSIAFSESPSTGIYRVAPSTVGLAIAGVARQTWTPTEMNITGNLVVSGTITSSSGGISFVGPILVGAGTAPLPAYSFTADPNTGVYNRSADSLGFATNGLERAYFDANGRFSVNPSTLAGSPSILAGTATSGISLDVQANATEDMSMRFVNSAYTEVRAQVSVSSSSIVFGGNTALPIFFFTNALGRVGIAATGGVTFNTPTSGGHVINGTLQINAATTVTTGGIGVVGNSLITGELDVTGSVYAPNFYVSDVATGAGTYGISGGLGAAIVTWGTTSAGLGTMDLYAGGFRQMQLAYIASAVNYHVIYGGTLGNRISYTAAGVDTNIGMQWIAKGTGDYVWFGGTGGVHFQVVPGAAGTGATWIQIAGNTGTAPAYPTISSNAARVTAAVPFRFTNASSTTSGDVSTTYLMASATTLGWVNSAGSANNKVQEIGWSGGVLTFRVVNDAYTLAHNWMTVAGGYAAGISSINLSTASSNAGSTVISASNSTSALHVSDVGAAGGNIKITGDGATTPSKYMRVSAGALQFLNNGYSLVLLGITDGGVLTDYRGATLANDPSSAASHTVGSIVQASYGAGAVNAFATIVASGGSALTVFAIGAGSNGSITSGTWRALGARDSSTTVGLWIRTA